MSYVISKELNLIVEIAMQREVAIQSNFPLEVGTQDAKMEHCKRQMAGKE